MDNNINDDYRTIRIQLEDKIDDLNKVINIIDSDISDYNKAYEISKIYNNLEKFKKEFLFMLELDSDDQVFGYYVSRIKEICLILKKYEKLGIMGNVNYVRKREKIFDNYLYGKYVIESYIEYSNSYNIINFLEEMGINQEIFDFCIETIKELDLELYNEYVRKKNINIKNNYLESVYNLKDIVNGIKTGYLFDGTNFNLLEFFKRVPFKYIDVYRKEYDEFMNINSGIKDAGRFGSRLLSFSKVIVADDYNLIKEYVSLNEIQYVNYVDNDKLKEIYSGIKITVVNNGRKESIILNDEIIDKLYLYMVYNKLPLLSQVFNIVKNEYLCGNIDLSIIDNKKGIVRTLIP